MNDSTRDRGAGRRARLSSSIGERRDDSIVRCWDALLQGNLDVATAESPESVAIIQQVRVLDDAMRPYGAFLDRLEQELGSRDWAIGDTTPRTAHLSCSKPNALRPGAAPVTEWGNAPSASKVRRQVPSNPSWASRWAAAAVLAILLIAGPLVLYRTEVSQPEPPAIPAAVIAKPTIEPIARFEFEPPMWDIPDATAWTHMETGMFSVAPATSFTTDVPFYTAYDGPMSLVVATGQLTVTPAGPAFFYPANQSGRSPMEVSAGQTMSIGPNEAIVFSAKDAAAGSNSGAASALAVYSLAGKFDKMLPGSVLRPQDVTFIAAEHSDPIPSLPTKGATMTVQRLDMAPFDTFVFEPDVGLRYLPLIDPYQTAGLRIDEGAVEGVVPQPGAQGIYGGVQLRYLKPGPHTIFNLSDKTVSFFFLVVEPAPAATPTP